MADYDILRPWLSLDPWQKEYIENEGNSFLLCGRQVGKSTAASIKAVELAVHKYKKGEDILIIATTERQAYNLFTKCLNYALARYAGLIKMGKDKPTKHNLTFKNGVKIMCHPTGLSGEGLRGFTIKKIIADEASRMADEIFTAIRPMVSVTGGSMDLLSTPAGQIGYFYEASKDPLFKHFYVSAEDCPRHTKEFLENEKARMTDKEYLQEYHAVFLKDVMRFFEEELIKAVCILKRAELSPKYKRYMGVDIARLGEDTSTFEIIEKIDENNFRHIENVVTKKQLTNQTEDKIIELYNIYKPRMIGLDAGSGTLGVSVLDHLRLVPGLMNKVIGLNNRDKSKDTTHTVFTKTLKEDLYNNLKAMLQRGHLKLLDDDEIIDCMRNVQYEYVKKLNAPTKLRIFAVPSADIVEGLTRAAWLANQDKSLNIWCM